MGGELTGMTYVLDEPTIGLHPTDTNRLIKLLNKLSKDNTVVVVEHDEEIIRAADHIIELGPGAGVAGGELIASGTVNELLVNKKSITAPYLVHKPPLTLSVPKMADPVIKIQGANANNLKKVNLTLPTNGISVITGVSGSGKSSLLFDVIAASAMQKKPVHCTSAEGLNTFNDIKVIDQRPLTGSVSGTLITYLDLYDYIRNLFAATREAGEKQLNKSHFSFNVKGGRCETCKGQGQIKISMDFLADVWVTCPDCNGTRFNSKVLGVKTGGLNIAEVLELTVQEAINFFGNHRKLKSAFELLAELGLGHLKLGQPSSTFSGGEAQRLKMTAELIKPDSGKCLYLLDEPTTGLHFRDIEKLINVLNRIAANGQAVYIIEHHPWLVDNAGYIVELGPEGGKNGGKVVFQGKRQ
jgi:excinuclease ABC subunit A